jgi:Nucleotidyl transferase AbiEii toxin, Type IV TA system
MSERYTQPQALRQAVEDRLRLFAKEHPGTSLADLQRQFAYDRLLSRVFYVDGDRWVLKGATAMLARLGSLARHTADIDLYRQDGDLNEAEAALNAAASLDLGDHFRFALNPGRQIVQDRQARRIPVVVYIGATEFAQFHVDLVVDIEMIGMPEEVSSLVPIDVPGLVRARYRAYPVADHMADKVCAMLEVHRRQGRPSAPSTRYRDLADLAIFAHAVSIDAQSLVRALNSEARRRGLELPGALPTPEGPGWRAGYVRVARDAPLLVERDLDSALETVRKFIDPILQGVAAGSWNPDAFEWSGEN